MDRSGKQPLPRTGLADEEDRRELSLSDLLEQPCKLRAKRDDGGSAPVEGRESVHDAAYYRVARPTTTNNCHHHFLLRPTY
jgi:hypothetical protein